MNPNPVAYLVLVAVPAPANHLLPPGVTQVPSVGQTWALLPATSLIGREPAVDIVVVLPWQDVSRRHAQIEMIGHVTWEMKDLQSRNGTAVNGQKLQPNVPSSLSDGDRIRISDCEFVFRFQLDPPASLPQPVPELVPRNV